MIDSIRLFVNSFIKVFNLPLFDVSFLNGGVPSFVSLGGFIVGCIIISSVITFFLHIER